MAENSKDSDFGPKTQVSESGLRQFSGFGPLPTMPERYYAPHATPLSEHTLGYRSVVLGLVGGVVIAAMLGAWLFGGWIGQTVAAHWGLIWELLATGLAVSGCWLNNRRRRVCFVVWIASNLVCMVLHWRAELGGLVVRDVLFSILAVHGWFCWRPGKADV